MTNAIQDCTDCDGSGEDIDGKDGICPTCKGAGFVRSCSDTDFDDLMPDYDGPMPNDGGRDEP